MLHNYSCPVARVMACIDAAAVVRREWSGPYSRDLSLPASRLDRRFDDREPGPG